MIKDWTGDKNSIYKTLGASSHTEAPRHSEDYYATEPKAIDVLLKEENFVGTVWEPACGEGHLSIRLQEFGHKVRGTDLVDRGYGEGGVDFLTCKEAMGNNIITNPPYKLALEFCQHALEILPVGGKLAMFLKLTFLEGKKRKNFFKRTPPLPFMYLHPACYVLKTVTLMRLLPVLLPMRGLYG